MKMNADLDSILAYKRGALQESNREQIPFLQQAFLRVAESCRNRRESDARPMDCCKEVASLGSDSLQMGEIGK